MVLDGRLSMGHARELSKFSDSEQIKEYAKKIVDDNLSVRDIEDLGKDNSIKRKNPVVKSQSNSNNEFRYIERELSEYLGTKVKINGKKMEISFTNVNDLDRLLELMNIKLN